MINADLSHERSTGLRHGTGVTPAMAKVEMRPAMGIAAGRRVTILILVSW